MPSNQDSRERRRRQNRESQQRRRQRQKWRSQVVIDCTSGGQVGKTLTAAERNMRPTLATIELSPSQPQQDHLHRSQALMDCYLLQNLSSHALSSVCRHQDQHQQQYQYQHEHRKQHQQQQQRQTTQRHPRKSDHDAASQASWPAMSLNFSTVKGYGWEGQCKEDRYDSILASDGANLSTKTLFVTDNMTASSTFHQQSPASMRNFLSRSSTSTQHATFDSDARRCMHPQMQTNHSTMGLSRSFTGLDVLSTSNADRRSIFHPDVLSDESSIHCAEKLIKEVQDLYRLGVKVGLLRKNDQVRDYLATMRRIYLRNPFLMRDIDAESPDYIEESNQESHELWQ